MMAVAKIIAVAVGVKLEYASRNQKHYGNAAKPPSGAHCSGEAGYNQKYRANNVANDG